MKIKRILIVALSIIAFISSYKYLKLKQEYRFMLRDAKYDLVYYLNSSLNYANKIDFDKGIQKDGDSALMLAKMYADISKSYSVTRILHEKGIAFIDPMDIQSYQSVLLDDLNKAEKNELKKEDIDNFKLLTEDIRLIYRYVNSNNEFGIKKYYSQLRPSLKIINSQVGK